jgi:hypothetical protein
MRTGIRIFSGLLLLLMVCFVGCEQRQPHPPQEAPYQMLTSRDGSLYRLNKQTGQMVRIEGENIVPLKNATSAPQYREEEGALAQVPEVTPLLPESPHPGPLSLVENQGQPALPKKWHDLQLNGKNLKCSLQTSCQEEVMRYQFDVYPYASLKKMMDKKEDDVYYQRKWHGFILKLIDNKEAILRQIPIKLWGMSRIFDNDGKLFSVRTSAAIAMSKEEYESIADYAVAWKLDWMLLPDYKFTDQVDDLIQTYQWYGEVDRRVDPNAPAGAKYWWITFPEQKKVYFSTQEELLKSYKETTQKILDRHR